MWITLRTWSCWFPVKGRDESGLETLVYGKKGASARRWINTCFLQQTPAMQRKSFNLHLAQASYLVQTSDNKACTPVLFWVTLDLNENHPKRMVPVPSHNTESLSRVFCVPCLCISPMQLLWPLLPLESESKQRLISHIHQNHSPLNGSSYSVSVLWLSCLLGSHGGTSKIFSKVRYSWASQMTFTRSRFLSWFSCLPHWLLLIRHLALPSFASHSLNVPLPEQSSDSSSF